MTINYWIVSRANVFPSSMNKDPHKDPPTLLNRLQSIIYDSQYIEQVSTLIDLPVIANQRCGSWYVRSPTGFCYFKSTDGHNKEWKFSYRRLNYHLIPIINKHSGIMVVDSSKHRKLIPDALSKTVPIWCAVLNYINFGETHDNWLWVPEIVSQTEKAQISEKIKELAAEVERLHLSAQLQKPLRPYWMYPGAARPNIDPRYDAVVCVSASQSNLTTVSIVDRERPIVFDYVPGAADDHELWNQGVCNGTFDASFFWKVYSCLRSEIYLHMSDQELVDKISDMYNRQLSSVADRGLELHSVKDTGIVFGKIVTSTEYAYGGFIEDLVILSHQTISNVPKHIKVFHYKLELNKKGSKQLREILPKLIPALSCNTMVVCDTGSDLGVAIVLILLCQNFTTDFVRNVGTGNKDLVKRFLRELNNITVVNPSRNTLQSVNEYLYSATRTQ